jgi:tRNA pseudouridine55 synthase
MLEFGVVSLDKPPGPSAHQVAAWVRDMVNAERAAHAGTLDPKVTGCLPVLLGDATRVAGALLGEKEYVAVLELHADPPGDLEAVIAEFEGPTDQKPPRKSAVKREIRVRELYELDVLEVDGRQALLRIRCESGTYVRKLCHDLGLALGTGAHMGHLRRTATTPFDDTELVTLHDLADALAFWREDGDDSWLREVVAPAERALEHLPRVIIAENAAAELAAAIVGGGMAAGSHSLKAGGRALINTSPEPFSNWTASIAEDVAVIAGLWVALHYPLLFLPLLAVFIAVLVWLLPKITRGLRVLGRRVGRFFGRQSPGGDDGPERLPNNGP